MTEARLRIGAPAYLAAAPCVDGLEADARVALVRATPAELVDRLRNEALDAALVSSIEAFRRPGYRYVRGIGIAAEREVRSVLLFARKRLTECRTLALDPASRAGAALAQVILTERTGGPVDVLVVAAGADPAAACADAWLRIGDAALAEAANVEVTRAIDEVVDLAAEWFHLTGLPFVFALWLVGPGARFSAADAEILARARERGCARLDTIASQAAARTGLPRDGLAAYLRDACRFILGEREMRGLAEFHRRASRLGLADANVAPEPL